MGGSGGGGWTPTTPSNPCERIKFRTTINSPQPAIVPSLKPGDVLQVMLQTTPMIAVIVLFNGAVVGALVGTQVNGLVNCIQNGYQYEATVFSVAGGNCVVDVSHV